MNDEELADIDDWVHKSKKPTKPKKNEKNKAEKVEEARYRELFAKRAARRTMEFEKK